MTKYDRIGNTFLLFSRINRKVDDTNILNDLGLNYIKVVQHSKFKVVKSLKSKIIAVFIS